MNLTASTSTAKAPPKKKGVLTMSALVTLAASMQAAFGFRVRSVEPGSEVGGGGFTNFDYSPTKTPGPNGPAGVAGSNGTDGADGEPGQSLEGAAGERGDAGAAGPPGPAGMDKAGIPGPRGPRGPAGSNGPDGEDGPEGYPGRDGISIKGPDGEQGDPGPPALKTAIMPAHGRYVGLIAQEAQDVLFEDILRVHLPARCSHFSVPLDPIFLATLEPGTLLISAALPTYPVHIDAHLENQKSAINNPQSAIQIRLPPQPIPLAITITLHGIRRGMAAIRQQTFTAADVAANNAFYRAAHDVRSSGFSPSDASLQSRPKGRTTNVTP